MVSHTNFFETIQEAKMRLKDTVVRYKDDFYYVLEVAKHPDGKFRVYMDRLGYGSFGSDRLGSDGFPYPGDWGGSSLTKKYDSFIEKYPDSGFIRKLASSKHFEKFRPFPLGNVNVRGGVVYCERSPTRNMHQGLLRDAILATNVESVPKRYDPYKRSMSSMAQQPLGNAMIDHASPEFYSMLKDDYPTFQEVVENLSDPAIMNKGCAFHREYSIMRGPLDFLFLCHRHSGVGLLDSNNNLILGSSHEFLLEELTELGIFQTINVKEVRNNA